jgi:hypothetical protein
MGYALTASRIMILSVSTQTCTQNEEPKNSGHCGRSLGRRKTFSICNAS